MAGSRRTEVGNRISRFMARFRYPAIVRFSEDGVSYLLGGHMLLASIAERAQVDAQKQVCPGTEQDRLNCTCIAVRVVFDHEALR